MINGDSIEKYIAGWHLNKRMRSTASDQFTVQQQDASFAMLKVEFPDFILLHQGTNDLNSNSTSEGSVDKILNLATSIKTSKNQIFVSRLAIRKDKLNKK